MAKLIRKVVGKAIKWAFIAYVTNVVRKAVYGGAKKVIKKQAKKIVAKNK